MHNLPGLQRLDRSVLGRQARIKGEDEFQERD